MPKFEIYQRGGDQRRSGHYALLIDGVDAEVTVDPKQFLKKAFDLLVADGEKAGKDLAPKADKLAHDMAAYVIERRIRAIQEARIPGGVNPAGFKSGGINAYTSAQRKLASRTDEKRAIELYLNRGHLKGLDTAQRKERLIAPKHDCDAEWLANRTALIKQREKQLEQWEGEHKKGNPKALKYVEALTREVADLTGSGIQNASHGLQFAFTQYWTGAINLVSDDIRIWPLMTNTTLDTIRDAVDTFSDITADEFDGANYSAGGLALDNQAVAVDDANDRAEFSADDEVVANLGAGTRPIQGVGLGKFVVNTAGSLPLHWIEFASNKTPDGSNFTFDFSATDGIMQMTG
jgi:hypothetical protein